MGKREGAAALRPGGASTAQPDPVPRPPLHRRHARRHKGQGHESRKQGPRRAPTRSGGAASEHRDRADPRRLQLAGHREGGEQGHQARLLLRPAAAACVDCVAELIKGFAGAEIDVHEHLPDRAAEGGGMPWGDGEQHRSPAPPPQPRQGRVAARVSPGAAVVVRAVLGEEGLARPVAGSGTCCFRLCRGADLRGLRPEPRGSRCRPPQMVRPGREPR